MFHSAFHFRKTKRMPGGYHSRKLAGRHRFRDVSHIKFPDIFKSLRRRRLRPDVSPRSVFTHSLCFPSSLADCEPVPTHPPSLTLLTPPSPRYRSDLASILSATEGDCSSGMSTSRSFFESDRSLGGGDHHVPFLPMPAFPTSPSMFQLRSASTTDHLVEGLARNLGHLTLGDNNSIQSYENSYLGDISIRPDLTADSATSPHRTLSDGHSVPPKVFPPHDQNFVPMILVTSVDAKHPKPLPPSSQRRQRVPLGPSNFIDLHTDIDTSTSKPKLPSDDPFRNLSHEAAYSPDENLVFRLPSFPSSSSTSSEYSPETPTPMSCDHFGDCSGDMWEVLHPPLVAGKFTLPPFELPPMTMGFLDDIPSSSPY